MVRLAPWLVLIVALAAGWYLFGDRLRELSKSEEEVAGPATVRVQAAGALGDAMSGIAANGYIVARRRAALSTVLSGRLVEIRVEEGQRVKADEIIARIQYDDYESRLAAAKASVSNAEARRDESRAVVHLQGAAHAEANSRLGVLRSQLVAAESEAAEAERERDRQKKSFEDGVIPESVWDGYVTTARRLRALADTSLAQLKAGERALATAQARLESAKVATASFDSEIARLRLVVTEAEIELEKTNVRAPFDGVIVDKGAEEGEVVSATGAGGNSRGSVATLVDLETLEVQVELPEIRLGGLTEGQGALIFLDVQPTRSWPGKIRQIWPRADRQKGTVEIRIVFDEMPPGLREEMGLRVVFRGDRDAPSEDDGAGLSLPKSAILESAGQSFVFRVDRGILRKTAVKVLREEAGRAFFEGDLRPGVSVLAEPRADLQDGQSIEDIQ